jgi:hypothetical protein
MNILGIAWYIFSYVVGSNFFWTFYEKWGFPLFYVLYFGCFLWRLLGDRASVATTERQAHRATMNIVLVCSVALTIIHTGCTITDMRCTLALCEFETTVSALVESTFHWNIHLSA